MIAKMLSHPLVNKVVNWMTRRRAVAHSMFWGGLLLLTAGGNPMWLDVLINVVIPMSEDAWSIGFERSPVLAATRWALLTFGCLFLLCSVCFYVKTWRRDGRRLVLAVEFLGLRDSKMSPLAEAIPRSMRGTRKLVGVDLRQNIIDGELSDPERALEEVAMLPGRVKAECLGLDRRDVQVVAGGLAPVPLLFLGGVLLDDESEVSLLDWDRHRCKWRRLDGAATGERLETALALGECWTEEVALCVSVSYRVNLSAVSSLGLPMIHLELPAHGTMQHWSEFDQAVWGEQFLESVMALEARDVTRIHLFVAAPGSVVIRMGRLYDKRNLPALGVYQYQRSPEAEFPYPWGIEMPVAGRRAAEVITL